MVVADTVRETNFDVVPRNVPLLGDVMLKASRLLNIQKGHHTN
jgi:hypothetical protein